MSNFSNKTIKSLFINKQMKPLLFINVRNSRGYKRNHIIYTPIITHKRRLLYLSSFLRTPNLIKIMPFGKYKGLTFDRIPLTYLFWLYPLTLTKDLLFTVICWLVYKNINPDSSYSEYIDFEPYIINDSLFEIVITVVLKYLYTYRNRIPYLVITSARRNRSNKSLSRRSLVYYKLTDCNW